MNDDIILLQKLAAPVQTQIDGNPVTYAYGIDGTENNFYAVPSGLTREGDPITYDVCAAHRASPTLRKRWRTSLPTR